MSRVLSAKASEFADADDLGFVNVAESLAVRVLQESAGVHTAPGTVREVNLLTYQPLRNSVNCSN